MFLCEGIVCQCECLCLCVSVGAVCIQFTKWYKGFEAERPGSKPPACPVVLALSHRSASPQGFVKLSLRGPPPEHLTEGVQVHLPTAFLAFPRRC